MSGAAETESESRRRAACVIGSNVELITEILTHLPIHPILRFKSVNKQWHTTISHPWFCLLHSLRHPHPPPSSLLLLLPHHPHSSPSFVTVPLSPLPLPPPPSPFLLHSSNGLFLSLSVPLLRFPLFVAPFPSRLLVSNPTSLLSSPLPSRPRLLPGSRHPSGSGHGAGHGSGPGEMGEVQVGVSLGFDPGRWAHYYVVRVFKLGASERLFMEVYDSRRGTWGGSRASLDEAPFDTDFDRGVYWQGRVFWLSHTGSMVYYDLETDVVATLVLPKLFELGTYLERFRYFGESCGHLHLVEIRTNCVREFDVLELVQSQDGGVLEWFVKFRVDLDLVGFGFEDDLFQDGVDRFGRRLRFYAFSILAVIRKVADDGNGGYDDDDDDGESCAQLVLSIPGKVISYNFKNKVSRLLCNVVDESDRWLPFRGYNAFQYIESLYCP